MKDVNLLSFVAPVNNKGELTAGLLDASGPSPDGTPYASALKFSGQLQNFKAAAKVVHGGHDACVDVNNRASGLEISADMFWSHGEFVATIKGGASYVVLTGTIFHGGTVTDVMLDDWSDQSHEPTHDIVLCLKRQDGAAVRVIALKNLPVFGEHSGPYSLPWWTVLNFKIGPYWLIGSSFEVLRRWGFFRSAANS